MLEGLGGRDLHSGGVMQGECPADLALAPHGGQA